MRSFMIAGIVFLIMTPAYAQGLSGGRKHHQPDQKTEQAKKKPDDKEYKASLSRIPDRKYDPWHDVR